MPAASSFPIFLRATMPQVPSPDTGDGLGCGQFRVYLPQLVQIAIVRNTLAKRR